MYNDNENNTPDLNGTDYPFDDIYNEKEDVKNTSDTPYAADPDEETNEIVIDRRDKGSESLYRKTSRKKTKKNIGSIWVAAVLVIATVVLLVTVIGSVVKNYEDNPLKFFDPDKNNAKDTPFQMETPENKKDIFSPGAAESVPLNKDADVQELAAIKPGTPLTVNQIAEKCKKSSVGILVEKEQYYFGRTYAVSGVGSGFILSEDGYIATNNHVVQDATKITVVLDNGSEYDAEIIGTDSITDIAVIKIEAEGLPVLERGNSDDILVGDYVVAIGTPATIELAGTVTDGIISAVDRKIDITDSYGRVVKTMTLIQTNATINPGNSGGPLINQYGQVIGINTLKLTDKYEGIGFAIPINGAVSIMNQLIADGTVSDRSDGLVSGKASIGIQCADVTPEEAEYYGIPEGVLVMQINKDGSAAKAGLRRGDIITAFDGEQVKTRNEINTLKESYSVGDKVTLTVFRDGEGTIDITFALDMQVD